ncbi:hypothetical protein BJ875DRAFT_473380 [Amylocarpus encephaloides]|uniref:Uncharacterized protein n=1 Tax=Amylocarpus encephaloides TaxID=45428 RepID=A0A9P7YAD2_9HELO|nr:hypothetical protein BJ875DRAFT_473380 [Amylocarpus encephaloides]
MEPSEMVGDFTQGFGSFYFLPDDDSLRNDHICNGLEAYYRLGLRSLPQPPMYQKIPVDLILERMKRTEAKTGVFPFMRLPLELRIRVYDLLISSLISSLDEHEHVPNFQEIMSRGIKFQLCDGEDQRRRWGDFMDYHRYQISDGNLENGALDYLDIYKGLQDGTITPQTASGWHLTLGVAKQLAKSESEECELDRLCDDVSFEEETESSSSGDSEDSSYSKSNNSCRNYVQDHVKSRSLSYVQINAYMELHSDCCEDRLAPAPVEESQCCHRSAEDYEVVRRLAYISRQFTTELGACVWRNSILDVQELGDLGVFLKTRPSAAKYVRGLIVHFEYNRGLDMQETQLEGELNFVDQQMNLLFISLRYRTSTDLTDHNDTLRRLRSILSFKSTRKVFDLEPASEIFYAERGGPGFTERSGTLVCIMHKRSGAGRLELLLQGMETSPQLGTGICY